MILTIATVSVKEGQCEEFQEAIKAYRAKILDYELGTIMFDLFQDSDSENAFTIAEIFQDEAALEEHLAAPFREQHLTRIRASIAEASASTHQAVDAESLLSNLIQRS